MLMHILTGASFSGYYYSSFIEGDKYTKDMMEIGSLTNYEPYGTQVDWDEEIKKVQDQLDALVGDGEGSVVEQIAKALQAAKDYADEKDTADKT